mmetsp:Transcript_40993/g.108349  ORF Transcript_40993/g.108349 Transcript_40993/m.108349 type:complete len:215 (+) Transcript_40993:278-922(+)
MLPDSCSRFIPCGFAAPPSDQPVAFSVVPLGQLGSRSISIGSPQALRMDSPLGRRARLASNTHSHPSNPAIRTRTICRRATCRGAIRTRTICRRGIRRIVIGCCRRRGGTHAQRVRNTGGRRHLAIDIDPLYCVYPRLHDTLAIGNMEFGAHIHRLYQHQTAPESSEFAPKVGDDSVELTDRCRRWRWRRRWLRRQQLSQIRCNKSPRIRSGGC